MDAEEKIAAIHTILDEFDGEEAVKRIREILYGASDEDEEEDKENG